MFKPFKWYPIHGSCGSHGLNGMAGWVPVGKGVELSGHAACGATHAWSCLPLLSCRTAFEHAILVCTMLSLQHSSSPSATEPVCLHVTNARSAGLGQGQQAGLESIKLAGQSRERKTTERKVSTEHRKPMDVL